MLEFVSYMNTTPKENIILVRHGDTKMNTSNEERGWSKVPLSSRGKKEAQTMSKELKNKGLVKVFTSDLPRAKQTAGIISKNLHIPLKTEKGLRTWNTGKLVGMKTEEIKPILDHLALNKPNERAPGGESFNQFKNRYNKTISGLIKDKNIAIVTHSNGTKLASHLIKKGKVSSKDFVKDTIKPGHFEII